MFLVKGVVLGTLWFIILEMNWLNDSGLNTLVIQNLIGVGRYVLEIFGSDVFTASDVVGIAGTSGVQIGAPCNALDLMALFIGILALLPGLSWVKWTYALIGILIIHILNLVRVIVLILMVDIAPEYLEFNHNYTFTLIMYVFIFTMWVGWVRIYRSRNE